MRPFVLLGLLIALLAPNAGAHASANGAGASWSARVDVEVPKTDATAAPQMPVSFHAGFTNQGTGAVQLVFSVVSQTGDLNAPAPAPVTLQAQGERTDLLFVVQTPFHNGHLDEVGTVTYRMTPTNPSDPTMRGDAKDLTFTVRTRGWYAPGPGVAAAALGAVVVALLTRRSRA